MEKPEVRGRVAAARVARLATIDPDGRPNLVPICFALAGDVLYTAVDHKPKRSARLRRLENVRARPSATVIVDHYEEDWSRLWWVRLRGPARVEEPGSAEHDRAVALLAGKYGQYRRRPPEGPVIAVEALEWRLWSAAGGGSASP